MSRYIQAVLFFVPVLAVSCDRLVVSTISGSPEDLVARDTIDLVQQGCIAEALQCFDLGGQPGDPNQALQRARSILPAPGNSVVDLVSGSVDAGVTVARNYRDETFVYHVKSQRKAALVFAAAHTEAGVIRLRDFQVYPAPISLRDIYPFRLGGMSLLQYAVLACAIAILVFVTITAVACVRSKRRKKWLWMLFSLVGIGKLGVQWLPAGSFFLSPAIQLFGASILKYPFYTPWAVSISLPLGTMLFWATNRRRPLVAEATGGTLQSGTVGGSEIRSSPVTGGGNSMRYIVGAIGFLLVLLGVMLVVGLIMGMLFPSSGHTMFIGFGRDWRNVPGIVLGLLAGIQSFRASIKGKKR